MSHVINRSNRLLLRQLMFGQVDAKYEVLTRDPQVQEHFRKSYLEPSGMNLDEFIKGERFFIHGQKGAGKTALLRYLQITRTENHCLTKFTSFATDISDSDRKELFDLSGIETFEQGDIEVESSAVEVWMVFILRQLAAMIEDNRHVFTSNKNISLFIELIRKFYDGHEDKGLLAWLAKTLKTGKYTIKARVVEAELKGEDGEKERPYSVSALVGHALKLLKELSWEGAQGIYLFFDELNLSFASRVTHKRDSILIRDLILAVDRLNNFFIENHKPVYILAAARSEVLHSINTPTHEINKILADRGRELRWFSKNAGGEWPITRLFERKVQASEVVNNYKISDDVFEAYFHRDVWGFAPREFIVEATWCNPRDLVYLFGESAKLASANEPMFGSEVLNRTIERYSEAAWLEKAEELSVGYAAQEIQSIKKCLAGNERHFKLRHFEDLLQRKGERDQLIMALSRKYPAMKILEDLYRVGIIGQSTSLPKAEARSFSQHWAYRGDNNFDSGAWMTVHKALWPELRLGRIWADKK